MGKFYFDVAFIVIRTQSMHTNSAQIPMLTPVRGAIWRQINKGHIYKYIVYFTLHLRNHSCVTQCNGGLEVYGSVRNSIQKVYSPTRGCQIFLKKCYITREWSLNQNTSKMLMSSKLFSSY